MATLTGNTIKDTYQSLLKVNDNGELAATLQEITDGVGNGSGVSLNTTGDLKAEGTIEFGSLKDTGEAITITKFVDEADGIANNDNDTSIPTSAAIIDYVAAKITEEDLDFAGDSGTGSVDLDSQIFTIGGTANQIETTATGQSLTIAFPSAGVVLPDGSTATTQATTDDSTKVATTAYVKSVLTQEDLDFQGDTGTGSVDLDSEVLDIAGGTGIDTVASGQTLTVNIDSTVATLTGTQTLTNKTINADNNTISNLEVDNLKSGVLDTDLTTVSTLDDTLASAKAIKTYVDSQVTAQDLDITDGTTTSSVDLDSETMTIQGTANEVEVSLTDQTFTVGLPDTINVNVSGNITGDITGNADTATALQTARDIALSGDVAGSASFDGTTNITISATIQADSVALGTDTTGDYVANLGTGTGVTIASNTGEGSQPTISVDYGSTANTAVQGNTEITINGTTNQIEITGTANQALGGAPSYTVGLPNDVTIAGSLIVSNDLTVNGTTTTVNTQTLSVEDPLIALAIANDANSVDTGFYAKYSLDLGVTTKFAGLFKDASDTDTFKLFKGLEVEPTTTVNTSGTGYGLADLQVAGLEATTITKTGGASTEFLKADGSVDSNTYLTAESDTLDAVTTRGNTTSNSIQVGAATVTGDLTVDTNTLYVDSTNNRVGIGTVSPSERLEVNGNIELSTSENAIQWQSGNGIIQAPSNLYIRTSGAGGNLLFQVNNNEKMRITDGGDISFRDTSTNEAFYWDASAASLGIGTTSITGKFNSYITATRQLTHNGNGGDLSIISDNNSTPIMYIKGTGTADLLNVYDNTTNVFTIKDGGNVGIGTSPSYKLSTRTTGTTAEVIAGFGNNNIEGGLQIITSDGNLEWGLNALNSRSLVFQTNQTERLRIDSSGVVSVGTTNKVELRPESYGGSTRLYYGSDYWLQYHYSDNSLRFQYNGVGNDEIVINSSGNVGIGTTSPASGTSTSSKTLHIADANVASVALDNTNQNAKFELASIDVSGGAFSIRKNTSAGTSGATELVRITSSGRVGIGVNPSNTLSVKNGASQLDIETSESTVTFEAIDRSNTSNSVDIGYYARHGNHIFYNGGYTERMRITSGGYLKASNNGSYYTSAGIGHELRSSDTGNSLAIFSHTGASPYGVFMPFTNDPNNTTNYFFLASGGGTNRFVVYSNGNVANTNNSYGAISDAKLKENITDASPKLDDLMQVKIRNYNLIGEETKQLGVVAQELEEVFPAMVSESPDFEEQEVPQLDENGQEVLDENGDVVMTTEKVDLGTTTKSVKYSVFVPMLIKAMQEQQEIINDLKARIEVLESN